MRSRKCLARLQRPKANLRALDRGPCRAGEDCERLSGSILRYRRARVETEDTVTRHPILRTKRNLDGVGQLASAARPTKSRPASLPGFGRETPCRRCPGS